MQTLNPAEIRPQVPSCYRLWMPDDDLPNVPELNPLDSAQARRFARQEQLEQGA